MTIYRICKLSRYTLGKYSHGIPRSEEWNLKLVEQVENLGDAKDIVKKSEKHESPFILMTRTLNEDEKEEFLKTWCETDEYISKRTFFILKEEETSKSLFGKIEKALKNEGVQVID